MGHMVRPLVGRYMAILAGTWRYWVSISFYCFVQGQFRAITPVYIEKVEVWLGTTNVYSHADNKI